MLQRKIKELVGNAEFSQAEQMELIAEWVAENMLISPMNSGVWQDFDSVVNKYIKNRATEIGINTK